MWGADSQRNGNRLAGEGGASLVEFAVILPLLIVLLFGVMEASWAFYKFLGVLQAERRAVRGS